MCSLCLCVFACGCLRLSGLCVCGKARARVCALTVVC